MRCDRCKTLLCVNSDLTKYKDVSMKERNYVTVTTMHHEWGNDSCDSTETENLCSVELRNLRRLSSLQ